jgi:hypothetical protein
MKFYAFALMLVLSSPVPALAQFDQELARRDVIWNQAAPKCSVGNAVYPTKESDTKEQPCDDGDMTLFSGLLCAAGDDRGCNAVKNAIDENSGLWHRSPRIRLLGKNDRGNADSSPDMAIGIQHYLVATGDTYRAELWLKWINEHYYCLPTNSICWLKFPKFCPTDDCILRPQDAAWLAATVNYLQKKHGMGELPDGPLRGLLGSFSGFGPLISQVLANVEDDGFPHHVNASAIWLLKKYGNNDPRIDEAAKKLHVRNPGNAFFSWLAGESKNTVTSETLDRCPADPSQLLYPRFQWQWERNDQPSPSGRYAWEYSCLWDCIFMKHLIVAMP